MSFTLSPPRPAAVALADGSVYRGSSFGAETLGVGEICFNTSMSGYQEILTDPSYAGQLVVMTYTQIGNVGVNPEDDESGRVWLRGFVVKEHFEAPSNWRARGSLSQLLREQGVPGIAGLDTRALVRRIRDKGFQNAALSTDPAQQDGEALVARARSAPALDGRDLVADVTCGEPYVWSEGIWEGVVGELPRVPSPAPRLRLVAYDFGVKRNILRILSEQGCRVTVVPATTSREEVLALSPDGVFLSNGPGDPEPCDYAIDAVRGILETGIPVFGICLGHQILALAGGARTLKMKFGHHGANHPVQDLATGNVLITSQNHGFAVDEASLPGNIRATHKSLFDGSLQGIHFSDRPAFGFQGHPEASPGPHDIQPLFGHFIELMNSGQGRATRRA